MNKRRKVYHYVKESNGNLLPIGIYNSITEAAEKTLFGRTTLGYHLNRYGSCSFNLPNSEQINVVSFRSLIVPNSIEPIIPHLDTEEDYELATVKFRNVQIVSKDNWLTKFKRWIGIGE